MAAATGSAFWATLRPQVSVRASDNSIGSPGHGLEPWLFDGSTVDDAGAERAIGHAAQRVAHLLQHIRIVFGFRKFLLRHRVRDARVANVMRRVDEFSPALVGFPANPSGQTFFEVEEALLVLLNVHNVFSHNDGGRTHLGQITSLIRL